MNKVTSIFKNRTLEHHDTMRQVSRSETPSGLIESLKHIARAAQPTVHYWFHSCGSLTTNRSLPGGHICPDCFVDQDGVSHPPPGSAT